MQMKIHLFGASTPCGEALRLQASTDLVGYSRSPQSSKGWLYHADLNDPSGFHPASKSNFLNVWVNFAPIWLLAPFIEHLAAHYPERLQGLRGVITCSSSSAITKRFASNSFDRNLVARLTNSENLLLSVCRRLSVPCQILRPTLIYGQVGAYGDQNLSRLVMLMRRFPIFPIPKYSGLRQPIHACQLAAVALHLSNQLAASSADTFLSQRIEIGGDSTLTYAEMISGLQKAQPFGDPSSRCYLLPIPNRLFYLLATPLLLRSSKSFEAVLRMGANLSGFIPVHQFLGIDPQPFPVLPLA